MTLLIGPSPGSGCPGHQTLRAELLDHVAPFESLEVAQTAIDGWVHAYNHQRPHQALEMAVPASRFRPNGPAREISVPAPTAQDNQVALPWANAGIVTPPPVPVPRSAAVEFEARVSPGGTVIIVAGRQSLTVKQRLAGRTLTVWADLHSIHLLLDGHVLRTVASRLLPQDLAFLAMRGARQAGPEPAPDRDPAPRRQARAGRRAGRRDRPQGPPRRPRLRRRREVPGRHRLRRDRRDHAAGQVPHARHRRRRPRRNLALPITAEGAARMDGARAAATPLPPPTLPAGSIAAHRRVHADGRIMVNKQPIKLGPRHAGKLVTVIIEDTCYRVLHGEEELAVKPRKDTSPITRLYVRGMKTRA